MFLNGENLQFASLLPVAGERLLLIKKADYFLLFLHSHVKPTLRATIKFVEATDTNCILSCIDHLCQKVFAVFR